MKKILCIASNNRHKIEELNGLLGSVFQLKTMKEIGCFEEIEETENTFQGNSLLKANYIYQKYGINCLADDSGLEVEALKGAPGVFSARFAGEHGNHSKNTIKLLENLKGKSNRNAQFRTVITLIEEGKINQFEGIVKGKITRSPKGEKGFGYDPVFIPEGYSKTFAEMTLEEKNPISHRGRAIAKLVEFLSS